MLTARHQRLQPGAFELECGSTIPDFQLSFVCHGKLNADRTNAVMILTSIGGDHHRLDHLIGDGGAFDRDHWFIVAVDAIGNGRTTSPSTTGRPRMSFPRFSIRDMVRSQHHLLVEHLGLSEVALAIGASMGGMQALQWAVSHPVFVRRVIALTPMAATTPWSQLVNAAARAALTSDPGWAAGEYAEQPEAGWRAWARIMHGLATRTPSSLGAAVADAGGLDAWLDRVQAARAPRMDAADWIYQSWAYDEHDVGGTPRCSGTADALGRVAADTLLLVPRLDLYNPIEEAERIAAHIPTCRLEVLPSDSGHFCTTGEDPRDVGAIVDAVRRFLDG